MRYNLLLILIVTALFLIRCSNRNDRITGNWEAAFSDTVHNPKLYLTFGESKGNLQLVVDEPAEDWYEIPGEKLFFRKDSLHFERFWGLEKYDAKLMPGDSVMQGLKQTPNKAAVAFRLKRISGEKLTFRIPGMDHKGKRIGSYRYNKPSEGEDNLACATLTEVGMDTARICSLINKILNQAIPNIHSLLILKDNKLVLEEYFYNYSADKLHRIHSVTKSFTSALTGIATDKGYMPGINEPVWNYFKDRDKTKWVMARYTIQVQHLLSMSAGLEWKGLILNESNDEIDKYKAKDCFEFLLNKNQKYQPGTTFCYNNGLSLMLGHILEKSTGLPVKQFADKFLFADLSITDYSWDDDVNGIALTDGGLKMRPRDMMKFGLLYLNKGMWNNKQIISADWVNASTMRRINAGDRDYGYHWWVKNYSVNKTLYRSFFALGHGEQAIIVVPDQNLAVVMTAGNYMQPEHRPFEIMTGYILPSLSSGSESKPDRKPGNPGKYTGEYQINNNESIKIVLKGNTLFAVDPAGATFRMIPQSPAYFIIEKKSREVYFVADTLGNIVAAEVFADGQRVEFLKRIKK
jgi:CubicO group peptidase (beta-lactamase class C family)